MSTNGQIDIQNKLRAEFEKIRLKSPSYTLRAYAKRLGLNSGALSGILSGKRRISRKMAIRLAERLMLDASEIQELSTKFASPSAPSVLAYCEISADQHRMISEWWYYAILSLVKLKAFREDVGWISDRLGITPSQAESAIDPAKIAEAKEKIRAFQDSFGAWMEQGNPTEVYRFTSALFPLTQPKKPRRT